MEMERLGLWPDFNFLEPQKNPKKPQVIQISQLSTKSKIWKPEGLQKLLVECAQNWPQNSYKRNRPAKEINSHLE